MQHMVSRPDPGGNTKLQTVVITAITLFALAGLLSGFAVGAFARPPKQAVNNTQPTAPPIASQKATPTPTPSTQAIPLGCPSVQQVEANQTADGTTTYTFSAQARDKSVGLCDQNNKPVTSTGITCRLWLIKGADDPKQLPGDRLRNVNSLNQPLPNEIPGALVFDDTTPQTQPCNQGMGTWKYRVSPSIDKGGYLFMVLTDWNGKYYNWSWVPVAIQGQ